MVGSLTRIRNNQVYNSDIDAATKLVPASITGALWANPLTYTGNLTVGNLFINGNTTSLDTINIVSADPVIVLNRNFSGANTYDVGFILGRGNQTNTALVWNESNKEFAFLYTSATTNNSYYGTIPNSGYANIHAYGGLFNNATITTTSLTNSTVTNFSTGNARITGAYIDNSAIGANTPNTGVFTTVTTVSGGQLTGYHTGAIGANTANTGVFTTLTATSGYQGAASGPLNGTLGATTPNTVVATSVTTTSGGQVIGYITGPVGANTANTGAFTTITTTGAGSVTTGAGQLYLNGATSNRIDFAQAGLGDPNVTVRSAGTKIVLYPLVDGSGVDYAIGLTSGVLWNSVHDETRFFKWFANTTPVATLTGTGNFTVTNQLIGYLTGAIGANTANSAAFTTLTASSTTSLNTPTAVSLSAQTIGNSGATIQGDTVKSLNGGQVQGYITGAIGANTPNTGVFTSVTTTSGGQLTGYLTGAIGANTANSGAFTTLTASSTTSFNTPTAVSLSAQTIGNSGATIQGNTVKSLNGGQVLGYLTGAIGANAANTAAFTTLTSSGLTTFTDATQASGYNSASVVLSGGLGVTKDTWIHGNVTIDGNLLVYGARTVIGADTFSVLDPIIDLHTYANLAPLTSNDGFDVGLKLHYYDTLDSAAFLGRANDTGYLEWYAKGTDVANVFTGTTYGTIKAGAAWLANTTVSTGTSSGALRVDGGTGIAGNLFVGGGINGIIGNGTAAAGTFTTVTTVSGGQLTGYHTGAIGANTANSGAFTTLTASSTTSFNTPTAVSISAGTIGNSGATIQGDTVKSLNGGQVQGYLTGAIGANTANSAAFTTLTASSTTTLNTATASSVSASTIGNSGATIQGDTVKSLNGGQVQGYLTGAIGANTANTGVFTSVTTVSGGQVTGYLTGAIGANTANSAAFTTLTASSTATVSGNLVAAATTSSTNTTTGSLVVKGGAGIAGDVNIGPSLTVDNGVYGNVVVTQFASLYGASYGANPYSIMQISSGGLTNGMGMQTYTGLGGMLYSTNSINFKTGATVRDKDFPTGGTIGVYIASGGNLVAASGTASTNTTTGALVVTGGAGVSGNVYSGSWLNATTGVGAPTHGADTITPYSTNNVNFNVPVNGNVVINSSGNTANLVVQGNTTSGYQNLLVTNGATGQVGIKKAPGSLTPYSSFEINATDSFIVPVGTSGQRPASGQEVKGMTRFNSSTNQFETWDGTQWATGGATFTLISSDNFVGTGAQLNFTLSQSGTTASTLVAINGIIQIPTTAYTVSGTTLTFTEAPLSTDYIDARVLATTTTLSILSDGTSSINVSNTAPAVYATVQNSNVWVANTSTYFSGGISTFNANTSLTQNVLTTVDTFSKTKFRSAKYIVTVSDFANTKYQTAEVLVVHNGTTATATTYGVASTSGSSFVNYGATVSGSNILLQANSTSTASYASVQQIYNPV